LVVSLMVGEEEVGEEEVGEEEVAAAVVGVAVRVHQGHPQIVIPHRSPSRT
jgi:hypothetical protein